MKTSKQWLDEVLASPEKLTHWLTRQFVGETLAAERIKQLATRDGLTAKQVSVVNRIAADELKHASWVGALLKARSIALPDVTYKDDRYWGAVLPSAVDLDKALAAGHHAETMRLSRIRLLASDSRVDSDIREVFARILSDEEFHAKAFGAMASDAAIAEMAEHHEAGLQLLGLEI